MQIRLAEETDIPVLAQLAALAWSGTAECWGDGKRPKGFAKRKEYAKI